MSDIDFVELDKAVNSLVSKNNPKPAASSSQPAPSSTEPTNRVSHKAPGRFMDVFHHSSDMMTSDMTSKNNEAADKVETPTAPPPRKVLNPIYNDIKAPPRTTQPPYPPPEHANVNLKKNDWPDPIDAAAPSTNDTPTGEPVKETTPPIDAASLFLPDTKVEKRPLGGISAEATPDGDGDIPLPINIAPTAGLPPELGADLVAIEEGGSTFHTAVSKENKQNDLQEPALEFFEDDEPNEPIPKQNVPQPNPITSLPDQVPEPEATPPKKEELSGLLAPGSIPQQYKTAAVSGNATEPTHPIFFDADQYNKAPDPGASKKPGTTSAFQWIFIIVGLLLLGATLGAALFVFVSNS